MVNVDSRNEIMIDASKSEEHEVSNQKTIDEYTEDISQNFQACLMCSSKTSLIPLKRRIQLMLLYQDIKKMNGEGEIIPTNGHLICEVCIAKLEKLSSFIDLALCNDERVGRALRGIESIRRESSSDQIGNDSFTCINSNFEGIVVTKKETESGTEVYEFVEAKLEVIDVKDETIERGHEASDAETYRTELNSEIPKVVESQKIMSEQCSKKQQRHLLTHTGEKPFKCDNCDKSFAEKFNLRQHLLIHTGKKPFKCNLCDKSFIRSTTLQRHLLTHTGEKPFKCSCCDKSFCRTYDLKMHLLTHTGERPFKCKCCDRSFTQKRYLRQHLLTLTGEKPFKCNFCDKSFTQKNNLRQHSLTHTGKKTFMCDYCDKSFAYKCNLRPHLLTHTGESPFKCNCCDRSFSQKSYLRRHLVTHTGQKPFRCDYCDNSFTNKRNLRKHLLTHTEEKPLT